MVIDAHVHIAIERDEKYPHCSIENVLQEMDRSSIDQCLVFPLVQCDIKENLLFVEKIKKYADRLIPMVCGGNVMRILKEETK